MNYISDREKLKREVDRALKQEDLTAEDIQVEHMDIKDSPELKGVNLAKVVIKDISFLTDWNMWNDLTKTSKRL